VSITDIERHQLRLLREKLGIDPPNEDRRKGGALEKKEYRVTQALHLQGTSRLTMPR
jgi:hypothetical protein